MEPDQAVVQLTTRTDVFEAAAGEWLAADPVGTNVIGAMLAEIRSGSRIPDALWILAFADGRLVGAGMHTPPFPLHLPAMPDGAVRAIAPALQADAHEVRSVSGDPSSTKAFARVWAGLTGAHAQLDLSEGVHVLDRLVPPSGVRGTPRAAGQDDVDLLVEWLAAFAREVRMAGHGPERAVIERRIAAGRLVLLDDETGRPVSVAGWHPAAAGYGRVGPVYTPPEHRRHGYAAAVTAAATQAVLDSGAEHVMLFTDLANPTSNGVYARLGYRQVREASEWVFTAG